MVGYTGWSKGLGLWGVESLGFSIVKGRPEKHLKVKDGGS